MVTLRAHLTHRAEARTIDAGRSPARRTPRTPRWVVEEPPALDMGQGCKEPINTAPHHAVVKAALRALTRWVQDGEAPRQSPAIELGDPAAADPIVRDGYGNAKGGIRLPELEAPTATIDGQRNDVAQAAPGAPNFCFLFGHTVPLDDEDAGVALPDAAAFVTKFTRRSTRWSRRLLARRRRRMRHARRPSSRTSAVDTAAEAGIRRPRSSGRRGEGAEALGMNPNTLRSRMRTLGVTRPGSLPAGSRTLAVGSVSDRGRHRVECLRSTSPTC